MFIAFLTHEKLYYTDTTLCKQMIAMTENCRKNEEGVPPEV